MQNSQKNSLVKCRIEGCDRDAMYIAKELCQKHYFRIMRNGHEKLLTSSEKEKGIRERKEFYITPNGYKRIYSFVHPLSRNNWLFEHRFVMYKKYGDNLPSCAICGKPTSWATCHIDHIDENRLNNSESNLRPLCRPCNTRRNPHLKMYEHKGHHSLTFDGETKTPNEWTRDPRVSVSNTTIIRRKKMGMSDFDALFSKKLTHNGNN